jgi:hypothetical protein
MDYQSLIIIPRYTNVFKTLDRLASEAKVVSFSGLPAVGKSLYIQQFSYLALSKGRYITTLQWDLARHAFETAELLSLYPESDGITHPCIRKACGLWARKAVYEWSLQNGDARSLLIVEAPLIGNRLVELAMPLDDEAEAFMKSQAVQFTVPVPATDVRSVIEARRKKTSYEPRHEQEKADANPFVVAVLLRELNEVAVRLGYPDAALRHEYNPLLYEFVYHEVLKHRNINVLHIDFMIDATESVYAFAGSDKKHLVPDVREAAEFIRQTNILFPEPEKLKASVYNWFLS